jgi:hypothetical protein
MIYYSSNIGDKKNKGEVANNNADTRNGGVSMQVWAEEM